METRATTTMSSMSEKAFRWFLVVELCMGKLREWGWGVKVSYFEGKSKGAEGRGFGQGVL